MLTLLRDRIRPITDFNQSSRDAWVAAQARRVPNGTRVLDVGAGPCRYAHLFKHCRYVAVDFVIFPEAHHRVDLVADIVELPFQDETFDVVLCTEVIEHIPEPIRAMTEIARVIRHDGELLLTAPLGSGLHQMPHHYYGGFTPRWYYTFLAPLGFEDIQVSANGGFFKHYGQETRRFSAMIGPKELAGVTGVNRVLILLVWLVSLPWFRLGLPLLCHWLDAADHRQAFTVGYHVRAKWRKKVD